MRILFVANYRDDEGVVYKTGNVRELPDAMAQRFIDKGVAVEHASLRGPSETKTSDDEPQMMREDDTADGEDEDDNGEKVLR